MLDVVDGRGKRSLLGVDHSLLEIGSGQAGVAPNNADDRNIDRWQNVGWRSSHNERRHQ